MAHENKAPALTPKMMRLAAYLLDLAGRRFATHGCSDLDLKKVRGFEERDSWIALDKAAHEHNGDPQEHDPETVTNVADDWVMMYLCAGALREAAKKDDDAIESRIERLNTAWVRYTKAVIAIERGAEYSFGVEAALEKQELNESIDQLVALGVVETDLPIRRE